MENIDLIFSPLITIFTAVIICVIKNNNKGERSFFYWRSDSAAKTLFENINLKILFNQISKYDAIYFSGITLSIYDQKNTDRFYQKQLFL